MSLKEVKSELSKTKDATKINLSQKEERDLISKYRLAEKITYQKLMTQMSKKKQKFPQPVRTQPTMEIFTGKDDNYSIAQRIVKLTAKDVKTWGNKIIADVKFDGIRAMIVVDPEKRTVRVLSRTFKTLRKFEDKYSDMILDNLGTVVKSKTVMDAELYALGPKGEILPGPTVTGWAKNPAAEKYDEIQPSVEIFDIMMLNSKDVRKLPLKYRKRLLEISLRKDDDRMMEVADTRMMSNSERLIYWLYQGKVDKRGFEGLVLKDPESVYFYDKPKPSPWKKVKNVDTLDLRLKSVGAYPYKKRFQFYKHFIMTVEDADLNIKADKGIVAADFGHDFYTKFTQDLIRRWKVGELRAGKGGMVKVAAKYRKIYGVDKVPRNLILGNKGPIVEIFVEQISDNLQPSGTKIVRIRDDKIIADKLEDVVQLRDLFRGMKNVKK